MGRKKKPITPAEPFWKDLIPIYFQFYKTKFEETPSFDGSSPRDLLNIIKTLRKTASRNSHEWTFEIASRMLKTFLEFSYNDAWLRDNFLLQNLNRQKDKIFIRIKAAKNKQSVTHFEG